MKQFSAQIIKNISICDNFFELTLKPDTISVEPQPGQFVTIRVNTGTSPLLRRPFAYSDFDRNNGQFSIVYQQRGQATEILSGKQCGDLVVCIGPIGNYFPPPLPGVTAVLVAGGIGIGPIQYLATELNRLAIPFIFIFGSRNKNTIPQNSIFATLNPVICTNDGSFGFKGTTADYLRSISIPKKSAIYCCGPHPMLKACNSIAKENSSPCWISVEQVMACGVGACMGCVVKVRSPQKYARACKEGPIFDGNELDWEE
jgi:dihydroorotate dehydrogenase electron transfer subunit